MRLLSVVRIEYPPDHVRLDEEDAVNAAPQSAHHATQPGLDVGALLRYERARFQTIKSLICGEVLEAIDFYGDQSKSLLPKVVTAFLSKVAKRREDDHRKCTRKNLTQHTDLAQQIGSPRLAGGRAPAICSATAKVLKTRQLVTRPSKRLFRHSTLFCSRLLTRNTRTLARLILFSSAERLSSSA